MDNLDINEVQSVVLHKRAYKLIADATRCQVHTLRSDAKWTLRQIGDCTGLQVTTVHRVVIGTPAGTEHVGTAAHNRRPKFPEEAKIGLSPRQHRMPATVEFRTPKWQKKLVLI